MNGEEFEEAPVPGPRARRGAATKEEVRRGRPRRAEGSADPESEGCGGGKRKATTRTDETMTTTYDGDETGKLCYRYDTAACGLAYDPAVS